MQFAQDWPSQTEAGNPQHSNPPSCLNTDGQSVHSGGRSTGPLGWGGATVGWQAVTRLPNSPPPSYHTGSVSDVR